jgi:hypothetical protein
MFALKDTASAETELKHAKHYANIAKQAAVAFLVLAAIRAAPYALRKFN